MSRVVITADAALSLRRRHPWVFAGRITRIEGTPQPGETVAVVDPEGALLGCGAYSPHSSLAVRMWRWDAPDIDEAFLAERLDQALAVRRGLQERNRTDACRLVHGEADGLPGLMVDRYGDFLVCQVLAAGAERWRETLVQHLARAWPCAGIFERSDAEARRREGLSPRVGRLWGVEPPEYIEIREGPARFWVDVRRGHKTGFYLDQRDNRTRLEAYARGAEVLNAYAYTGAFAVRALLAGARKVTNVETSAEALELGRRNAALNSLPASQWEDIEGSVPTVLRHFRDARRQFDVVVLDPPKFAESHRYVPAARRGYKDINWLAMRLLRPGGILLTFSCSAYVDSALFEQVVTDASRDAGRDVQVLARLGQPEDHPGRLGFPEATYLKGVMGRVL